MIGNLIYLPVILHAALAAGKVIMQVYAGSDEDYEIETKMDKSFLTKADKLAHAEISSQLSQTSYPLLSEEGRSIDYEERRHWKKYWIVDPLDGTKEFLKRNGEFTVNIALIEEGVPVMGVIYVPVSETLYFGIDGIGAYKIVGVNLDTASLTAEEWLKRGSKLPVGMDRTGFVVVASRSHSSIDTEQYIDALRAQHGEIKLISSGSSLKICLVAEGTADAYPRFAPTMEWDTGAGHAIARAAGLEIYQAGTTQPLQYNKENLLNPWFIVQSKTNEER